MSQEDQLEAILGNPQVMAQIQKLAQSLGQPENAAPVEPPKEPSEPPKGPAAGDMEMLKTFTGLARGAAIDKNQQALLNALGPYISRQRQQKLEKAMRAAKLAQLSSGLLESGALRKLTGV